MDDQVRYPSSLSSYSFIDLSEMQISFNVCPLPVALFYHLGIVKLP
jgi:hypothetical protein